MATPRFPCESEKWAKPQYEMTFRKVVDFPHIRRHSRNEVSVQRLINRRRIVQQDPLNNRKRQAAILDQVVVKLAQAKVCALLVAIFPQQPQDLPLADHVGDLL